MNDSREERDATHLESLRMNDISELMARLRERLQVADWSIADPLLAEVLCLRPIDDADTCPKQFLHEALWAIHEELRLLRSSFEKLMTARGWAVFGRMRLVAAWTAVDASRLGHAARADEVLVASLHASEIEAEVTQLLRAAAFQSRRDRIEQALEHHRDGEFPSVVSGITATIVDSMADRSRKVVDDEGLSYAWRAISTEDRSLNMLRERFIYRLSERKLRPTRDTGSKSEHLLLVDEAASVCDAVKSWSALFAIRDWLVKLHDTHPRPAVANEIGQ